jgi:hypothetical protein
VADHFQHPERKRLDEEQRVLDAYGKSIPRLYVTGELGSVFGHLYISGGDYAECLVGRVADRNAARLDPWSADTAERTAQPQA